MVLLKCPECKKKVSESASACPKCGFTLTKEFVNKELKARKAGAGTGALVLFAIVLAGVLRTGSDVDSVQPTPAVNRSSPAPVVFTQNDIDKTPSWYTGSKPWTSITEEGRREMLRVRRRFEANNRKASETPVRRVVDQGGAEEGKKLLEQICDEYKLDPYYKTAHAFGSRAVIWLPVEAWEGLTPAERSNLKTFMVDRHTSWGIGVGRLNGKDVLSDRLVLKNYGKDI